MKKSTIESTGRRRREGPSPSVQGIEPPSTLCLRLSTITKDVEWTRAGSGSDVERSMEEQLEAYVLATLDPMDLPPGEVALTFRFEAGQSSGITLKAIAGTRQRRAIMTTLTDALRRMVESGGRSHSPFPIEIVLDTRAGTATSVGRGRTKGDIGTAAGELTSEAGVGHRRAMSDVEQRPERNRPAPRPEDATQQSAQAVTGLGGESFSPKLRAVFRRLGPKERERQILAEIEAYASEYPGNIEGFVAEVERRIEPKRPPKTKRTLNLRMASERSGLSTGYLSQLCSEKILGEPIDKKPRFSEAELDDYVAQERKPGPKPKGGGA